MVLVASNHAFNVKFDCGACSPGPLQILTFAGGRTLDVTRQFLQRIAADADGWWNMIWGADPPALGLVVPWTADECELGKQTSAYATLDALNAAGKLVIPSQSQLPTPSWPEGSAFIAALKSFLKSEVLQLRPAPTNPSGLMSPGWRVQGGVSLRNAPRSAKWQIEPNP